MGEFKEVAFSQGDLLAKGEPPIAKLVPQPGFRHSEGNADAHIKASLLGSTQPVLIEDEYFTCRVTGGWRFEVTPNYDIWLSRV